MIYDSFENSGLYYGVGQRLQKALEFARGFDPNQADGRYEIDGDEMFAMVASYETEPVKAREFENHRRYIDVQVLLSGREHCDVAMTNGLGVRVDYNEEKDVAFLHAPDQFNRLVLVPSVFLVLFPHDAHRPNCLIDQPESVRKLVVKVMA